MKFMGDLLVLCGLIMTLAGCATPPLTKAVWDNDIPGIQSALKKGADVNAKNGEWGKTALMEASQVGNIEVVKVLLDAGADVNLKDEYDDTALLFSTWKCRTAVTQLLIDKGADVNIQNKGHEATPLMQAAECGDVTSVKALLGRGAKANVTHKTGEGALLYNVYRSPNVEIVRALLEAGENPNEFDGEVLRVSAGYGQDLIVKLLIEKGADIDPLNQKDRWAPLMVAARGNHPTTADMLIKAGADVNAIDKEGQTLLMIAVEENKAAAVAILVKAGANLNIVDKGGVTALRHAEQYGYDEIVKILRQAGAKE